MPTFAIIVALDAEYNIGYRGQLPWPRCPEDLRLFKDATANDVLIVGHTTYKALPPLPSRTVIVIASTPVVAPMHGEAQDVFTVPTFSAAMDLAQDLVDDDDTVWIIGGAIVFEQAIKDTRVTKALMTVFPKVYPADTKFPRAASVPGWTWTPALHHRVSTADHGTLQLFGLERVQSPRLDLYL